MMDARTKKIVTHLRALAAGKKKPLYVSRGLCCELDRNFSIPMYELFEMMLGWEYHSGDIAYPVPATDKQYDAEEQFEMTQNKWIHEQGWFRRDLCRYLADRIEERGYIG